MVLFQTGPCAYILLLFPESDISLITQSDRVFNPVVTTAYRWDLTQNKAMGPSSSKICASIRYSLDLYILWYHSGDDKQDAEGKEML